MLIIFLLFLRKSKLYFSHEAFKSSQELGWIFGSVFIIFWSVTIQMKATEQYFPVNN